MSGAGGVLQKHGNRDGRSTGEDRPTPSRTVARRQDAGCGTSSPALAFRQSNSRRHSPRAQTPQAHQRENQSFPATEDTVVPHRQSSRNKTFGSSGPPAGPIDRGSSPERSHRRTTRRCRGCPRCRTLAWSHIPARDPMPVSSHNAACCWGVCLEFDVPLFKGTPAKGGCYQKPRGGQPDG